MVRTCGRCGESKQVEHFAWRRRALGQRDNYCRACRAAYKQEHYLLHRQRYIENAQRRKRSLAAERAVYLIAFFESHPCVDCGERDPLVLEFDHLGDKLFNISQGLRDRAWDAVLEEMEKCDVVSANCHPPQDRSPRWIRTCGCTSGRGERWLVESSSSDPGGRSFGERRPCERRLGS